MYKNCIQLYLMRVYVGNNASYAPLTTKTQESAIGYKYTHALPIYKNPLKWQMCSICHCCITVNKYSKIV